MGYMFVEKPFPVILAKAGIQTRLGHWLCVLPAKAGIPNMIASSSGGTENGLHEGGNARKVACTATCAETDNDRPTEAWVPAGASITLVLRLSEG